MTTLGMLVCPKLVQEEAERTRKGDRRISKTIITLVFIFILYLLLIFFPKLIPLVTRFSISSSF
jgi:hypothetical protein